MKCLLITFRTNDEYFWPLFHLKVPEGLDCTFFCLQSNNNDISSVKEEILRSDYIVISVQDIQEDWKLFYKMGLSHGLGKQVLIISPSEKVLYNIKEKGTSSYFCHMRVDDVQEDLPKVLFYIKYNNYAGLWHYFAFKVFMQFKIFTDHLNLNLNLNIRDEEDFLLLPQINKNPLLYSKDQIENISLKLLIKDSNNFTHEFSKFMIRDHTKDNQLNYNELIKRFNKVDVGLSRIEDKLKKQQEYLESLLSLAQENKSAVQEMFLKLDSESVDDETLSRIDAKLEKQLDEYFKLIPSSEEIVKKWKEATAKAPLDGDLKFKIKFKIPFIFGDIEIKGLELENEFSLDGKAIMKSLKKEFSEWRRGERTLKQLFINDL